MRTRLVLLLLLGGSLAAFAGDFSDFRIPDHRVMSLTGDADLSGWIDHNDAGLLYHSHRLSGGVSLTAEADC